MLVLHHKTELSCGRLTEHYINSISKSLEINLFIGGITPEVKHQAVENKRINIIGIRLHVEYLC